MLTDNLFHNQCTNYWWVFFGFVFQRVLLPTTSWLIKKPGIMMSWVVSRKGIVSQQESSFPCAGVTLCEGSWHRAQEPPQAWCCPQRHPHPTHRFTSSWVSWEVKSVFIPWKFRPPLCPILNIYIRTAITCVQPPTVGLSLNTPSSATGVWWYL